MIYLDHAATTPICEEAFAAMVPYLREAYGNPSSLHHLGKAAKFAVEIAREQVAALLNARPAEIMFNSGATEGNNHAIKGVAERLRERGRHIVTTQIEHDAVLHPCQALERAGFEVTYVGVGEDGIVRLDELQAVLRADTILVSVMHANNEMGTLQPIAEIGALCREHGILFHCDACQTVGHIAVDVRALNVDLLTLSGHKFYGAKGAGALYIRRGVRLEPLINGGTQQKGRRAGTENVPGVIAMGAAAVVAAQAVESGEETRVAELRERLIEGIERNVEGAFLNGHRTNRVPGIANFSFDGVEGEGVILELDAHAGVCCSTGSACAAGSLDPSPVLLAIGRPVGLARAGTRFSLGRGNTEAEIDTLLELLPRVIDSLCQLSPETRAAVVGGQTDTAG
ncbi:MAG TPA: cysteine desulfurase family protein [Abditibacteriaceae bacterium]|nr:cysteine desulfurase family protein [Abditibacteriaceae bacterium]